MACHWTLRLLAAAAVAALRGAAALPAPAYLSTGVAVGEDTPALAYAGAGTVRDGVYSSVYDSLGGAFHSIWPLEDPWSGAGPTVWRSANAFRTNWKPAVTRRAIAALRTPIDLGVGYRCAWHVRPGDASVAVPVGAAGCSSVQEPTGEDDPPSYQGGEKSAVRGNDAAVVTTTTSLPPHLGEAAQLVMYQTESEADSQPREDPVSEEDLLDAPSSRSRRRRQVSRVGRRGASSSAAAASASSGPWGSSASAAAASAASGGRGRPAYGYRPNYYGRRPVYGRPYPGQFYG